MNFLLIIAILKSKLDMRTSKLRDSLISFLILVGRNLSHSFYDPIRRIGRRIKKREITRLVKQIKFSILQESQVGKAQL